MISATTTAVVVASPEKSVSPENCVSPEKSVSPDKCVSPENCVSTEKVSPPEKFVLVIMSYWVNASLPENLLSPKFAK